MTKWASVFLFSAVIGFQSSSCMRGDPYTSDTISILSPQSTKRLYPPHNETHSNQRPLIPVAIHTDHALFSDCKYFFDDESMRLTKNAYLRFSKTWSLLSSEIKIISGYNTKNFFITSFRCRVPEEKPYEYLTAEVFASLYGGNTYFFLDAFYLFTPIHNQKNSSIPMYIDSSTTDVSEALLLGTFFHEVCHTLDPELFDNALFPVWYVEILPKWKNVFKEEPKQFSYLPKESEEWAERCGRTIALEYSLTDAVLTNDIRLALGEQFAREYPQSHAFFKNLLAQIVEHHSPNAPIPEIVIKEMNREQPSR